MKIAVCFCGQIRTGVHALPNIKRYIDGYWGDCDFFIHTWNYENSKPLARSTLGGVPVEVPESRYVPIEEIDQFSTLLNPKKIVVEDYEIFAKNRPVTVPNIVWYTSEMVLDLRREYELENNFRYDVVLKIRPDIIYPSSRRLDVDLAHFSKNRDTLYSDLLADWRLDDVLWIMSSETADKLSGLTSVIDGGKTFNPCSIVLDYCKKNEIKLSNTVRQSFRPYAVLRRQSSGRNPLTQFKEIYRDDVYYYTVNKDVTEEQLNKMFKLEDERGVNYD